MMAFAAACQATPETAPPPPQATVISKPAIQAPPEPAPEPETGGAPIALTPASEGREQLAAYAPPPEAPVWRRGDAAPDDLAAAADPCGDHGGVNIGSTAQAGSVQTSPDPFSSVGSLSSPSIGALRAELPSSLYSPTLRRLIKQHLAGGAQSSAKSPTPKVVEDHQLADAEKSTAVGAMPVSQLRQAYQQFPFEPEELEAPLTDALEQNSPRRRALLFRAASAQQVPTAIAEVMKVALELARPANLYEMTLRLYGHYIRQFEASFALRWIGFEVGPAQFYLGERCKAKNWRRYLESIAPNDPDARRVVKRFWLWEALSGVVPLGQIDPEEVKNWVRNTRGQAFGQRKIQLAYAMVEAFGGQLPVSNWDRVLNAVRRQPAGARSGELEQAAQQSQTDEVVALSAIIAGARRLDQIPPHHVVKIIGALSQVGLADDARRFAVEVAIAAGL
ncbi:MAG: hypothetical protein CMM48_02045 [Rhodospirillaceae bacterium]|nr:hypothetical protein [Rhodospirillaceae bacterium]